MPVCSLKYLPKNEAFGKFRSLAISCIVMSEKRRRRSMAPIVKCSIIMLGRRLIVSFKMVDKYFGVTFNCLAKSSTLRMRPSLCSTNCKN